MMLQHQIVATIDRMMAEFVVAAVVVADDDTWMERMTTVTDRFVTITNRTVVIVKMSHYCP